jgi:hypothetical protein
MRLLLKIIPPDIHVYIRHYNSDIKLFSDDFEISFNLRGMTEIAIVYGVVKQYYLPHK